MGKILKIITGVLDFIVYCNYRFFLARDATPHFTAVLFSFLVPISVVYLVVYDSVLRNFGTTIEEHKFVYLVSEFFLEYLVWCRYKGSYAFVDRIQPLLKRYNVDDWVFGLFIIILYNSLFLFLLWLYLG